MWHNARQLHCKTILLWQNAKFNNKFYSHTYWNTFILRHDQTCFGAIEHGELKNWKLFEIFPNQFGGIIVKIMKTRPYDLKTTRLSVVCKF